MVLSDVNKILLAVGKLAGLENFQLADNGCKGLNLADGSSLAFEWNADHATLYIYSPLIELPEDANEHQKLIKKLLPYNCIASGPIITLHPNRDELILQIKLSAAVLTVESLDQAVNTLGSHKEFLLNEFKSKEVKTTAKQSRTMMLKQHEQHIRARLNSMSLS